MSSKNVIFFGTAPLFSQWKDTTKKVNNKIYTYKYEKSQQNNGQKFKYKQKIKSHDKNKGTIKAISKCQYHKTFFLIS